MFKFQMKVGGAERKGVAGLIAQHFGAQAAYRGAPGFEYVVTDVGGREWVIDKVGTIITQFTAEDNVANRFLVLTVLDDNGLAALGQAEISFSMAGHNGMTLRNLVNILAAKQKLIAKTMGIAGKIFIDPAVVEAVNAVPLKTVADFLKAAALKGNEESGLQVTTETITFRWFAPSLNPETIKAYIQFALAVNRLALTQKHASAIERESENEKFSFRTWLLRLGFIGDQYQTSRKVLLGRLTGDSSFKTREQARAAAAKRKKPA